MKIDTTTTLTICYELDPPVVIDHWYRPVKVQVCQLKLTYVNGKRQDGVTAPGARKLRKDGTPSQINMDQWWLGEQEYPDWLKEIVAEMDVLYAGQIVTSSNGDPT